MNHHIIYKQKATITVSKEAEAYAVQNEISDVMKNELPQLLQSVFDSVTPDGDVIRIDSLHLDLGTLPSQNIRQVFKERIVEKIREAITVKAENSVSENGVNIIRKEQSLREAFIYFLQYGIKPWFIGIKNRDEWESEMQQRFSKDDWQKIILWLRQNHQQPVVIERLVQQFSDDFIEQIITRIISFAKEQWKDIYEDLRYILQEENRAAEIYLRPKVLRLCISSFLKENSLHDALYQVVKKGIEDDSFRTIPQSPDSMAAAEKVTKKAAIDKTVKTTVLTEVLERIKREESPSLKRYEQATKNKNEDTKLLFESNHSESGDGSQPLMDSDNDKRNKDAERRENFESNSKNLLTKDILDAKKTILINNEKSKPDNNISGNRLEEEPQYVNNSGIVLLHPFLEMYFAEFGLLHKRKFIDDNACQRAVLLLHYLATGETESEEWNLLLQKMMCGLSLEDTLPNRIELSNKEKEESERLLQSVINYCPPLKNTSLAGLRSTFLQREGRLEKKENGWLLTVEQKTVDLLLDKLPWGFSTIKLPWLADMITVDWC